MSRGEVSTASTSAPEHHSAAARLALLTEATAVLGSTGDVDTSLGRLARLLVPTLADICSMSVIEDGESLVRVAVAAADPSKQEIAKELEQSHPANPDADTGVAAVVRTGQSLLYEAVDDDLLRATAHDDRYYELTAQLGVRSVVIVPLRARGRTMGAMSLLSAESGRHYTSDDLDFAEGLARWVALTLDNARLLSEARLATERFRELVDNLEGVVFEADPEPLRFTFVSNRAEEILGYPTERWLDDARSFLEIVVPEDRETVEQAWRNAVATGGQHTFEYRVTAADGRDLWLQDRVEVVRDSDGRTRVLGLVVDVTHEVLAARRLVAQHATSRALAEAGDVEEAMREALEAVCTNLDWKVGVIWEVDDPSDCLRSAGTWHAPGTDADAFLEATRQTTFARGESLPGEVWERAECLWISDLSRHPSFQRSAPAAAAGLHSTLGCPIHASGRVVGVVEFFSSRILEPDEELLEMLASIGHQMGQFLERRRAQEAAAFQAALLEAQADTGIEGQLVVSPSGSMLSFNRRFAEMWGVPDAVLEPRDDAGFLEIAKEQVVDPGAFIDRIRYLYAHPAEHARDEVVLRDGRVFDRYGAPLVAADGAYYGWAWYFRDVTEQRRVERELRESRARFAALARTLQASLLPPRAPTIPGLDIAARYSAAGEGLDVGGDFYDVFPIRDDQWGLVVGDVCGKGAQAAAVTALARYTVRAAAARGRRPSRVLGELNDAILRDDDGGERFCTVVYGAVRMAAREATVDITAGGHPLPLVVRARGTIETAGRTGTLVGAFRDPTLHDDEITLAPGDAIVFFTDGVLEARADKDLFGLHRLVDTLLAARGLDAATMADRVIEAVVAFAGKPRDDIAIVVLRVPR